MTRRPLAPVALALALAGLACQPKTPVLEPLATPAATPPGPARTNPPAGAEETMAPNAAGPQRIGCFNIEWLSLDGRDARTDAQLQQIALVVQQSGVALFGLEEVQDDAVMDRLVSFLPGWKYQLGASGRQQKCGMLWDASRASVRRAVEWPDINDGVEKREGTLRDPLAAEARVGKFDFLFVVVHLKAMFDEEAIRTRREQCRRLRVRLDEWVATHPDKDVIVVGDFNDKLGSPALSNLTRRAPGKAEAFVFADNRLPESVGTYIPRSGRIDHVLVSSPHVSQEEWSGDAEVFPKPRGAERKRYLDNVSDHLPMWATFDGSRDRDP